MAQWPKDQNMMSSVRGRLRLPIGTTFLMFANLPETCYTSTLRGCWNRDLLWRSRSGGHVCISDRTWWGSTNVISKTRKGLMHACTAYSRWSRWLTGRNGNSGPIGRPVAHVRWIGITGFAELLRIKVHRNYRFCLVEFQAESRQVWGA